MGKWSHVVAVFTSLSNIKLLEVWQVDQLNVELDEIQSLDLQTIVKHKAQQAYEIVKGPVLVEDVSLEFNALGKLPGTFISFQLLTS